MEEFPDQQITAVLEKGEPATFDLEEEINFSENIRDSLYSEGYHVSVDEESSMPIAGGGETAAYAAAGIPGPETLIRGVEAYSQLPQEWQALAAPGAILAGVLTYQTGKGTLKYIFK